MVSEHSPQYLKEKCIKAQAYIDAAQRLIDVAAYSFATKRRLFGEHPSAESIRWRTKTITEALGELP